jgi:hypothetical protein
VGARSSCPSRIAAFPTKAVHAWLLGDDADHIALVRGYLERAGFDAVAHEVPPSPDDPLLVVSARA